MNLRLSLLLLVLTVVNTSLDETNKNLIDARIKMQAKLDKQFRNSLCCAKNMRCCKTKRQSSHIEIRAILTRCPNTCQESATASRRIKKPIYATRAKEIKNFPGFDKDEPLPETSIKTCRKKLILNLVLNSSEPWESDYEYVVVDHVYDPVTDQKARLFTPYVVKIKQEAIMQMYGLKFVHVVNSKVFEQVYNKHNSNYSGCDTTSNGPTCGRITYKGKKVPYSEGFCCSCDALKNTMRQPESNNEDDEIVVGYSDPALLLDGIECPRNLKGNNELPLDIIYRYIKSKRTKPCSLVKKDNSSFPHDDYSDIVFEEERLNREKRQILPGGTQIRGGQNCADRYTPEEKNLLTYHESTHCLRFSNLWYTVHQLQRPMLEHSVLLQVFEKHEDRNGQTKWKDITKGKMARVGTIKRKYLDSNKTISITYSSKPVQTASTNFAINYKKALLLIPDGVQKSDYEKYPEIQNGPSEYLVVHSNQISLEGNKCNMGGVGFEAFAKQPNRCGKPRGTCLGNQPFNLWLHDHQAQKLGKTGCFFLQHYGKLPKNPIRINPKTSEQYLVLEYDGKYKSKINFEIKADFNTVLRFESSARITEVYIDSTGPRKTSITIKITNAGLISGYFMARLTDCPLEIPASFNNIETKLALIPPQHQHIFNLKIRGVLPVDRFHCSVEALNSKRELLAIRRIRIQKYDRCFCTWHCLCACVGSSEGLKCFPMSLQHYHAAGFKGSLPVATYLVHNGLADEIFSFLFYLFLVVIVALFGLGLIKALIGAFCSPSVGILGLDVILDLPKPLMGYYEGELRGKEVFYDDEGWPVHPDTYGRVRSVSKSTEFCINVVFFFAYPFSVFVIFVRRVCCSYGFSKGDSFANIDREKKNRVGKNGSVVSLSSAFTISDAEDFIVTDILKSLEGVPFDGDESEKSETSSTVD